MKRVFICSSWRDDDYLKEIIKCNNTKEYCKFACLNGVAAFAPQIFYTQFLHDCIDSEKELISECTFSYLGYCNEIWVFADFNEDIDEYMKKEIEYAKSKNITIRYFTTSMVERTFNDGIKD